MQNEFSSLSLMQNPLLIKLVQCTYLRWRLKILQISTNLGTMGFFCPEINSIQHSGLHPPAKKGFPAMLQMKMLSGEIFFLAACHSLDTPFTDPTPPYI